jgi:hypothetical protein
MKLKHILQATAPSEQNHRTIIAALKVQDLTNDGVAKIELWGAKGKILEGKARISGMPCQSSKTQIALSISLQPDSDGIYELHPVMLPISAQNSTDLIPTPRPKVLSRKAQIRKAKQKALQALGYDPKSKQSRQGDIKRISRAVNKSSRNYFPGEGSPVRERKPSFPGVSPAQQQTEQRLKFLISLELNVRDFDLQATPRNWEKLIRQALTTKSKDALKTARNGNRQILPTNQVQSKGAQTSKKERFDLAYLKQFAWPATLFLAIPGNKMPSNIRDLTRRMNIPDNLLKMAFMQISPRYAEITETTPLSFRDMEAMAKFMASLINRPLPKAEQPPRKFNLGRSLYSRRTGLLIYTPMRD